MPNIPVDGIFDRFVPHGAADLPGPVVFDASRPAMRQRSLNFAAKRFADMMYVSGLDRATAERHFRWRAAAPPAGLSAHTAGADETATLAAAHRDGALVIETSDGDRRVTVRWQDIVAHAIARPGYGGILLGPHETPRFDPAPVARAPAAPVSAWEEQAKPDAALRQAADAFFAASTGAYGVFIATWDRVLLERYSAFGRPDRVTPSWSMTKAVTCTVIGRMIQEGWLGSVHDPAPAPLWRDPRDIHRRITLDHLLRMRSGLAFPVLHADGSVTLGFENSAVYQNADDAFVAAQRSIVATEPGSVFRYVNSGVNVLGAIIRDRIESRGLPYNATLYGLLADRIGMSSYQHSADIAGNLIASGAGFATLRDYARLGLLYLQGGVWGGERLLPEGWADYALTPTHSGTSYAACFRANTDRTFPSLPPETAWASGASDQRIFILRQHGIVASVANETDHPLDLAALDRLIATALELHGQ